MATKKLYTLDFVVIGRVQEHPRVSGVFFRKHTEKQANQLGLHGWCMNTSYGTVRGQIEGPAPAVEEMKYWLRNRGSPKSRIDKALFTDMKDISAHNFQSFTIRR